MFCVLHLLPLLHPSIFQYCPRLSHHSPCYCRTVLAWTLFSLFMSHSVCCCMRGNVPPLSTNNGITSILFFCHPLELCLFDLYAYSKTFLNHCIVVIIKVDLDSVNNKMLKNDNPWRKNGIWRLVTKILLSGGTIEYINLWVIFLVGEENTTRLTKLKPRIYITPFLLLLQ